MHKPGIIPIFVPFAGCPRRCVFCDQRRLTGEESEMPSGTVARQLEEGLIRNRRRQPLEAAFYGGSFTALPAEIQRRLLAPATEAMKNGRIASIRISTRPDAVDSDALELLASAEVSTVELGVQSLDDKILQGAGRGHDADDSRRAISALKAAGFRCGIQLMTGLPHEDWPSLIRTVEEVVRLMPDFIRLYPTLVLAGTRLAELYAEGRYRPLTLQEAISRAAYVRLIMERNRIPMIRTGLQPTAELSASPST